MPRVVADRDSLNERNSEFEQGRLETPVFLNSVPKSGTHLLRNLMRMFVPVDQQYADVFIQHANLRQHMAAYDPSNPRLSWGHLLFSDESVLPLHHVNHVVLIRDPYDWVLARARFFLSDTFQGDLEHLKGGRVSLEEVLNMMIFGIPKKAPALEEIFRHNAVSWMGTSALVIQFEQLRSSAKSLDSAESKLFFERLFGHCGMRLTDDWSERIEIGSDPAQSGTARENLKGLVMEVPDTLPDAQKEMVDYVAPGLRKILGYI